MSRLLFILAVAAVVYWLVKSYRTGNPGARPSDPAGPRPAEDMVRCIYCGVHLPKSESIMDGGKYYCCEAHRRAHQVPPANRDAG